MAAETESPLVLTLAVDPDAQARWDRERAALFPAGRTRIGAHVTLFHALPADLRDDADAALEHASDRPRFPVRVTDVMRLGRGAAYRLESLELAAVHRTLQNRWRARLTPQDAQPLRAHVTVQNKVDPATAEATVATLQRSFAPGDVEAAGLDLWRYDGGPWTHLRRFPFSIAR